MILVFGKFGQVASALQEILPHATFLSSKESDFLNPESVIAELERHRPKIIINASAYTAVDKAEDERAESLKINAETPGLIALWCKKNQATLIHYSTDYVFSGLGEAPWVESDLTSPVNWYGETKLIGENLILEAGCAAYIFRISWVYSPWGQNFKKTILRLAKERTELNIVEDQWGAPTDARDVANLTARLVMKVEQNLPCPLPGIYHLRFEEYQSWYQFALRIVEQARSSDEHLTLQKILPIASEAYPTKAKRPKNSRLGSIYAADLFD